MFCLLLSTLAVSLFVGCATNEKKLKSALLHEELGVSELEAGQYPQALQELLTANQLAPDNPEILNNLGLAYYVRGKYFEAIENISKALKYKPSFSEARNNLGRVLIDSGKYDQAQSELQRVAVDLTYPTPEKVQTNLGLLYIKKNDLKLAKTHLLKAIQLNKEFCPGYNYYGQALFRSNDFENAANIFDRAIKICNKLPEEVQYYSALSYYKLGESDKAIARFEEISQEHTGSEYAQKSDSMLKILKNKTE
jgi:type IV pilus assembly protein PilF